MVYLYDIEYKYLDSLNEPYHYAYAVVYDSTEIGAGETLDHALECSHEDGDYKNVDRLLGKWFGITDEDVCFYHDTSGDPTEVVLQLQQAFDIHINYIKLVDSFA